jgi:hypothetical protein
MVVVLVLQRTGEKVTNNNRHAPTIAHDLRRLLDLANWNDASRATTCCLASLSRESSFYRYLYEYWYQYRLLRTRQTDAPVLKPWRNMRPTKLITYYGVFLCIKIRGRIFFGRLSFD